MHYTHLARMAISPTERRVMLGETVPVDEKVVSIFEEHTDIIVKDRRETNFGHKICLTSGKSGLFLDCIIEEGNPADSGRCPGRDVQQETRSESRGHGQGGWRPRIWAYRSSSLMEDSLADICYATHTKLGSAFFITCIFRQ